MRGARELTPLGSLRREETCALGTVYGHSWGLGQQLGHWGGLEGCVSQLWELKEASGCLEVLTLSMVCWPLSPVKWNQCLTKGPSLPCCLAPSTSAIEMLLVDAMTSSRHLFWLLLLSSESFILPVTIGRGLGGHLIQASHFAKEETNTQSDLPKVTYPTHLAEAGFEPGCVTPSLRSLAISYLHWHRQGQAWGCCPRAPVAWAATALLWALL